MITGWLLSISFVLLENICLQVFLADDLESYGSREIVYLEIMNQKFIQQYRITVINNIYTYMFSYMQNYWSWSNIFKYIHLLLYWESVNIRIKCCIPFHLYNLPNIYILRLDDRDHH